MRQRRNGAKFVIDSCILSIQTAWGLKCYTCTPASSCTTMECPALFDRCYSLKVEAAGMYSFNVQKWMLLRNSSWKLSCFSVLLYVLSGQEIATKGCQMNILCLSPFKCCEGNLCNSAKLPTGSSLLLLLASSALAMIFL